MPVKVDGSDLPLHRRQALLEIQEELKAELNIDLPEDVLVFRCTCCKVIKVISDFPKQKEGFYGIRKKCYSCRRKQLKTYPPQMEGELPCASCKQRLPVTEFSVDKHRPVGRSSWCRQCISLHAKTTQENSTGIVDEAVIEYRRQQTLQLTLELGLSEVPQHDIKRCWDCKEVKPIYDFYPGLTTKDRVLGDCITCRIDRVKQGNKT